LRVKTPVAGWTSSNRRKNVLASMQVAQNGAKRGSSGKFLSGVMKAKESQD
jgi:hypothetical protein